MRQGGGNSRPGRVSDPDGKTSRAVARPQRARKQTPGAAVRAADPHKIPIDPNGNLTSKTDGTDTWTYSWNAENQLTKVEKNGAEQARFAYDPLGRRVDKTGGITTAYTYDGRRILREVRGAATLKYVHAPGLDEPLRADDGTATSYFHSDALGSVAKVTDSAGAAAVTRQYDAWGNLELGGSEPGYSFTGREWDPETGLYYYRARYYAPKNGSFISEDPVDYGNGLSRYGYVLDNPIGLVDPLGLTAEGPGCSSGKDCHPDVRQGASDLCNYSNTIADANVRQCVQKHCKDPNSVRCPKPHQYPCNVASGPAYSLTSSTATICANNPIPVWTCWKRIIAHEWWVHGCRPQGPAYDQLGDRLDHNSLGGYLVHIIRCP